MMTIVCQVVGEDSVFPVDLSDLKLVGHLKECIKAKKQYRFPADGLDVFLAQTKKHTWLRDDDPDATALMDGNSNAFKTAVSKYLTTQRKLLPARRLRSYFAHKSARQDAIVHVLVSPDRGWRWLSRRREELQHKLLGGGSGGARNTDSNQAMTESDSSDSEGKMGPVDDTDDRPKLIQPDAQTKESIVVTIHESKSSESAECDSSETSSDAESDSSVDNWCVMVQKQ